MNKIVLCGVAAVLLTGIGIARAQGIEGQVSATMNPTRTSLEVPSLTGRPEYTNVGDYYEGIADLRWQRLVFYGAYQFGRAKRIEGGTNPASGHFNPLTGEKSKITDVSLGYRILGTPSSWTMDVGIGYFHIWDGPDISPSTTYTGASASLRGHRSFENGFGVDYRVAYIPDFKVDGYGASVLEGNNIVHYRLGVEYAFHNSYGVTAGYQDYRIHATVKFDQSTAFIHPRGVFAGVFYKF